MASLAGITLLISTFAYISQIPTILSSILIFTILLVYSLGSKDIILNNPIVKYLSKISMEIYLCHMLFFRVMGILNIGKYILNPNLLYIVTLMGTLLGAIIFSHICKFYVIDKVKWLK